MPDKQYSSNSYRYGFNGKENDNEVKGVGNWQDYGMRMYDPRLCRFPSVDPISQKFPQLSPYQFASNTPIQAIDLDGLEAYFIQYSFRVSAPLLAVAGGTGSIGVGIAFDLHGNIGIYTQGSLGLSTGIGIAGGISAGANDDASTINDLEGWGMNIGGFIGYAQPFEISGELNWSMVGESTDYFDLLFDSNTEYKSGYNVGLPIPGTGETAGGTIYGEVSNTEFFYKLNVFEILPKDIFEKTGNFLNVFETIVKETTGKSLEEHGVDVQSLYDMFYNMMEKTGTMKAIELPSVQVDGSAAPSSAEKTLQEKKK